MQGQMARAAEETAAPTVGSARKPAQKRSLIRVNALLDAADALLQDREISDIGLYDVANAAKVPPTSAYHFFPTKVGLPRPRRAIPAQDA